MTRVSEYFMLGRRQPSLDFVDVELDDDTRLFLDPRSISILPSEWASGCIGLIQDFFKRVITCVQQEKHEQARTLLAGLREPSETRLGLSRGHFNGRGVGDKLANELWESLHNSEAVQQGLVKDLDDSVLLVDGVGRDRISDIVTNIIREPLIEYTQAVCQVYNIPLEKEVVSGNIWNPRTQKWFEKLVELPVVDDHRLLLVPKACVRQHHDYDAGQYFQHYILTALQDEELRSVNSDLVRVLKNKKRRVTKKDLKAKYGTGLAVIVAQTLRHPEALKKYRQDLRVPSPALRHDELSRSGDKDLPDFTKLMAAVTRIPPGKKDAARYEKAILDLLTALFYPSLTSPRPQQRQHSGRKRVDITFENIDRDGFFHFVQLHHPCIYVFVECKNYSSDPGNPELDQLSGRFSDKRGQVGLLVCRHIAKKDQFLQRCRDTAQDGRGWIIPLDDNDLLDLAKQRIDPNDPMLFPLLRDRFNSISM